MKENCSGWRIRIRELLTKTKFSIFYLIDYNKYSEEINVKVTGGFFITEAASTQKTVSGSPSPERKSLPDYNFLEFFL